MPSPVLQEIHELNQLVGQFYQLGRFVEAASVAAEALELARANLEPDDPHLCPCLTNLALIRHELGDHATAERLFLESLEVGSSSLGDGHPQVALTRMNLGVLYRDMGKYSEAEPLLETALQVLREALGEQDTRVAATVSHLATLKLSVGDYVAAEHLYRQALENRRRSLGERHPQFATSLNDLAAWHHAIGEFDAAESLFQQALDIQRGTLGAEHPEAAKTLNNLGLTQRDRGDYAAAKSVLIEALEIEREQLGPKHPAVAKTLDNLGGLYRRIGDHGAAESHYEQALEIRRETLGEGHPELAKSLNNLALLQSEMGGYAAAEDFLSQALEIQRAAAGARSPAVGKILSNLGLLKRDQALMREALEIERETLGETHPAVANCLTNLASVLHSRGDSESAEALLQQAVEIGRAVQGEDHPEVGERLNNLALLCAASGRQREALDLMKQVVAIDDRTVAKVFSFSTEARRAAFLRTVEGNFYKFLSLGYRYFADSVEVVRDLLDLVLRRKAIGAEALSMQREVARGGRYPELQSKLRELTTLQRQIAQKELAGAGAEGPDVHREILAGWRYAKDELEAELAQRIPEMDLEQTLRAVDRAVVAATLPEGSTLVEFVRCELFDFQASEARSESPWRPAHYLAFVLPARDPENIAMVDLGEARVIDEMIGSFRSVISGEAGDGVSRDLGATPSEDLLLQIGDKGTELRRALFDPLLGALGGCTRLIVAPDGDITRLPFEVLPTGDGRRLIHDYRASYVASGRDVLRFAAKSAAGPTQPIVAADPDFDLAAPGAGCGTAAPIAPGRRSRDLDRGRLATPLPATRTEGERVADMLGVEPWLSGAVLEAHLKACRSPRILHLATHGFFLEEQKRAPQREFRDLGAPQLEGEPVNVPESQFENPLLRSWLVLAGYNTWWKKQQPPPEAEDGILTAEDVVGLDLAATELVVLSACDTGLGVVRAGEGVFGMRRAFALAGAKTLVMSLWKVPDQQTQELMEDFYRRVLGGQPRSDALREAQLALSVKYPNPLYWGAFICQGDPTPLAATR